MAELTHCPSCSCEVRVPNELLGRRVKCPTCNMIFTAEAAVADVLPVSADPLPVEAVDPGYAGPKPRDPAVGFHCPFCRSNQPPMLQSQVSVGGWIVFVALLFLCLPLCWLGLFIKEDYRVCSHCKMKLG